jgi:hypothetical protein
VGPEVYVEAQPVSGIAATIRRLLVAYNDTLGVIEDLPAAPLVATNWRSSRSGVPVRLPRPSWMLDSLTLWHIDRVLAAVERALHRRVALGVAEADETDAVDAVAQFRASLPSRSKIFRISVLLLAALLVAHTLAGALPRRWGTVTQASVWAPTARLFNSTLGALQPTAVSVGTAVNTVLTASPAVILGAVGLLSVSLYLILRPVAATFRLKRLLFNLYPDARSMRTVKPASWSVSRSTGVYLLERTTLARLGAKESREPAVDLMVLRAVPVIVLAWMAGLLITEPTRAQESSWLKLFTGGLTLFLLGGPAIWRLAWLTEVSRARGGGPRPTWRGTLPVRFPWRSKPGHCRSAALIGWLSLLYLYMIPFVWGIWWSTARDLRDLGRAYHVDRLSRMHPAASAFAVGPGSWLILPPLIPLFRAPRQVREAQIAARLDRPVSRHVAWLAPLWPLVCVLLQHELNRLWEWEGRQQHEAATGARKAEDTPQADSDL